MKQSNFFENENENRIEKNIKLDENDEEEIDNICSFNYNSSIKERIFSRNPNLVKKLFGEDKKEKISENDDVNDFYNFLLLDNKDNGNTSKINIVDNKSKQKEIDNSKDNYKENNNENEQNLQGSSSIMNIFINPTITLPPNAFLNKKFEREKN